MKETYTHTSRRLFFALALLGMPLALCDRANAATLHWDGTDTSVDADGGDGDWDTTTNNWDTAATGGANTTWNNATPDNATFGGTAGTVTLGTNISVNNMTFNTSGYTVDLGGNTLTNSVNGTFITGGAGAVTATFQNGTVDISQPDGVASFTGGSDTITFASDVLVTGSNGILNNAGLFGIVLQNDSNNFTGDLEANFSGYFDVTSIADSGVASAAGAGSVVNLGNNSSLVYRGTSDSTDRTLRLEAGATSKISLASGSSLTWTGNVDNQSSGAKTFQSAGTTNTTFTLETALADNGANVLSFNFSGGGTNNRTILEGNNTFTGNITGNNQAKLIIDGAGTLGWNGSEGDYAGNITLAQGADFEYSSTANQTLSGDITDDGGGDNQYFKRDSGILTLSGNNTNTGSTTLSGGTLRYIDTGAMSASNTINVQTGTTLGVNLSGTGTEWTTAGTGAGTLDGLLNGIGGQGNTINYSGAVTLELNTENAVADQSYTTAIANVSGSTSTGITKIGANKLTIKAESTYTGATQVNGGTLEILADAGNTSLNSSDYLINNGSTLQLNDTTANHLLTGSGQTFTFDANGGGTLTLNGNILWRNSTIETTGGARNTVSGSNFNHQNTFGIVFDVADGTDVDGIDLEVSNSVDRGSITKNGDGTVLLTNNDNRPRNDGTSVNSITINGGTLEVGSGGQIDTFGGANGDWSGPLTINNDGIFKHSSDQTQALSGTVSGTGSIEKIDGAALTLSGNSTYSGTTTLGDGTTANSVIVAGSTTGLSSSSAFIINSDGVLKLNNFDNTIGSLAGAGIVRNADAAGAATTLTTGNDNTSTTFSGIIQDGAGGGALSLVKTGTGTMTMTGTAQHTGTTTVSEGTLSLGSGYNHAGTGAYTVGTDGTTAILNIADGVDISGHAMTINSGGVISPGNSPGTAITGSQTWNNGGTYLWEINDSGGTKGGNPGWDWLDITGSLDLNSLTAGGFTIDIDSLTSGNIAGNADGFDAFTKGDGIFDYSFTIATASGGITGFDAADFLLDSSGFSNAPSWDWQIVSDGTNLVLEAYAVPEPSSAALLGLGGLALALRRKRS